MWSSFAFFGVVLLWVGRGHGLEAAEVVWLMLKFWFWAMVLAGAEVGVMLAVGWLGLKVIFGLEAGVGWAWLKVRGGAR